MPNKITTEEFITRSVAKYGSFYDYSRVSYINAETKVCIICSVHGGVLSTPSQSLI